MAVWNGHQLGRRVQAQGVQVDLRQPSPALQGPQARAGTCRAQGRGRRPSRDYGRQDRRVEGGEYIECRVVSSSLDGAVCSFAWTALSLRELQRRAQVVCDRTSARFGNRRVCVELSLTITGGRREQGQLEVDASVLNISPPLIVYYALFIGKRHTQKLSGH